MKKLVNVVQSKSTGRFLFRRANDMWTLPSIVDSSILVDQGPLFLALEETRVLLGLKEAEDLELDEQWTVVYSTDIPGYQVFITTVVGEPQVKIPHLWASLFDFPDDLDPLVDLLLKDNWLIESFLAPD